eukprot:1699328-Prorocentrum_lima.AAC.1
MGTPYEAPPPMNWLYGHGQCPEARAVPQMVTPESHMAPASTWPRMMPSPLQTTMSHSSGTYE